MMKKILCLFGLLFFLPLYASETALLPVMVDTQNKATLQRGAMLFMNYCSGCHSLRYLRYNRMAQDLGLTTFDGSVDTELLQSNLIFTSAKPHDPIEVSMAETDARQWFGRTPPDLSLTARERGSSWVYTYLKSFYEDPKRPFGSNNLLVPEVSMPDILFPLRGLVVTEKSRLILLQDGNMTEQQFDQALTDLVTFLSYVAEPIKNKRQTIGLLVVPFLCLLLFVSILLAKQLLRARHLEV